MGREEKGRSRLEEARVFFQQHHARIEPDSAFVDRVCARLVRRPSEDLGLAAVRLLPATLVLILVLAWVFIKTEPVDASSSLESGGDDLVSWMLEDTGSAP